MINPVELKDSELKNQHPIVNNLENHDNKKIAFENSKLNNKVTKRDLAKPPPVSSLLSSKTTLVAANLGHASLISLNNNLVEDSNDKSTTTPLSPTQTQPSTTPIDVINLFSIEEILKLLAFTL